MAKACIICAKEVQAGKPVSDDAVIKAIRAVKQRLGIAKNNVLVVCPQCEDGYRKRRGEYEKKLVQYVVISAVVLLIFILLPIFTTGFSLWSLVIGLVFAAGVMMLSVFSHCPKAEGLSPAPRAKQGAAQAGSQAGAARAANVPSQAAMHGAQAAKASSQAAKAGRAGAAKAKPSSKKKGRK